MKTNDNDYSKFSYFLGGIDVTQQNLDQFTPYIQGVSRIFVYNSPNFMRTMFKEKTDRFENYIETGYTRVDGIGDISVDFVDFEGGFAGQRFSNVSLSRDETDSITISVYEQTGSPVREYVETWITGTRDYKSGIAHYHGALEIQGGGALKYSEKNHTAEFIYMTLDPTGKSIEYACMFAHAFPTKVQKSHLNYEKGNRDNVLMDLEFKVTKYESPTINQVAIWYLQNSIVEYNYLNFTPNISLYDVTTRAAPAERVNLNNTI
jgi:hypothetical protein